MNDFLKALLEGDLSKALVLFGAVAVQIALAVVLLWLGRKVVRWICRAVERGLTARTEKGMDPGLAKFLTALCRTGLYALLFLLLFELLGFPITSLVALFGSAGLAIGLALQGSLSNFAGGVLILLTRPFRLGDYIVAQGMEGTVEEIGICYTKLLTPDNRTVIMPNGGLANTNLINVSAEPERRVDIMVPIAYDDDIRKMRELLLGLAESEERVLRTRPSEVYVKEFGDSAIQLVFRCWVRKENYWPVYFGLMEEIRYAMAREGFTIPFPQLDVHTEK